MMRVSLLAAAAIVACASPKVQSDSTSLQSIDTVKAATIDSAAVTDTVAPATTKTPTTSAKTATKTGTSITKTDTAHLGRDRAIKINTRDPKRRLPTVDTTKRPSP